MDLIESNSDLMKMRKKRKKSLDELILSGKIKSYTIKKRHLRAMIEWQQKQVFPPTDFQ